MKYKILVVLWNIQMIFLFVLCVCLFGMLAVASIFNYVPKFILMVTGGTSLDFTLWFLLSIIIMGVIANMNHYVCKHIATRLTIKIKSRGHHECD